MTQLLTESVTGPAPMAVTVTERPAPPAPEPLLPPPAGQSPAEPVAEATAMAASSDPAAPGLCHLIRVEKGDPSPEELAAVTVLLYARLATCEEADTDGEGRSRAFAGWARPDRGPWFDGPRTWRAGRQP
ncbi:acyl-CoA carboxylase subunit epsilon [Streptomyces sp. NPDC006879]|uniref:acyl-CoA carboxylase subunit epsilon n=1 Tax=Streptomyces sp. NPDC006879 TaxID=3364767 RepID=UPI0036954BCF